MCTALCVQTEAGAGSETGDAALINTLCLSIPVLLFMQWNHELECCSLLQLCIFPVKTAVNHANVGHAPDRQVANAASPRTGSYPPTWPAQRKYGNTVVSIARLGSWQSWSWVKVYWTNQLTLHLTAVSTYLSNKATSIRQPRTSVFHRPELFMEKLLVIGTFVSSYFSNK